MHTSENNSQSGKPGHPAGASRSSRGGVLVLSIAPLPRRNRMPDAVRAAAVLGGRQWLLRAWKRITALRNPVLRAARHISTAVPSIVRSIRTMAGLPIFRARHVRAELMVFRV